MRGLRALGAILLVGLGTRAHAQVCTESRPCVTPIGLPMSSAAIGSHRMILAGHELVWPSFIGVHTLDLVTGSSRSLAHCGTVIGDIAVVGAYVYVLADHARLCRVPLASGAGVQRMVEAVDAVVEGFGVSSSAIAWSFRARGEQPELRVMQWNGQSRSFPTAVTVEHVVVDATTIYWIDAGTLLRASIATGAKTVGPTVAGHVRRLFVDRGAVYVATDRAIVKLTSNGRAWTTLASEGADDLAVSGASVYWTSTAGGTVSKLGARAPLATPHEPRALAIDGASLFVAADDPLVIEQIAPR
ncbi:MAG TPA: hypothetical protein VGH28_06405 [Polyangiaceae bacterium]